MANFVFLHAHPDDEAIATAGLMAAAAEAGHHVTVVFATSGERGEVPDDLEGHATLGELRAAEARAAGALLGARVEFLGYSDSGMASDDLPLGSFAAADVDEAAARLRDLLAELSADAFVGYDEFGVTGHPDHVQTHVVGRRAAELAQQAGMSLWRFEGTMGQPQVELIDELMTSQMPANEEFPGSGLRAGSAEGATLLTVDVGAWIGTKRAAMALHASQIGEESMFLNVPAEIFAKLWGTEYYLAFTGAGPLAEFAQAAN